MTITHGLAMSIRSSEESDTFDLAGQSPETIQHVLTEAMKEPFVLEKMIRITLVVGGGKQSRSRYDPQAMRIVTSTLQQCGFQEDRGASCLMESQGSFKIQHDTGKNLKTVVVFPMVQAATNSSNNEASRAEEDLIFPKTSMEYKIAATSLSVFQNMVQARCSTWSQKKALLQFLEQELVEQIITPVDEMLMTGKRVPADLQHFYDNVLVEVSEKQQYVKDSMHQQVEAETLTQIELDRLLEQVQHRIDTVKNNPKALQKAKDRLKKLKDIKPIPHAKLKHHAELGKLWKEANKIPVQDTGGRLLSVHETKMQAKRQEIEEEIEYLEEASRGWLEEDFIFDIRLNQCRAEFGNKFSKASSGKKASKQSGNATSIGASTRTRMPVTKWITPAKTQGASKKKSKMKKGDVFSAMMAADSSDDDEGDDNSGEVVVEQNRTEVQAPVKKQNESKSQPSVKNANSKKKKNKKKKGKENTNNEKNETNHIEQAQEGRGAVMTVFNILLAIFNMLLAILAWFLSFFFGGKTKKQKKS